MRTVTALNDAGFTGKPHSLFSCSLKYHPLLPFVAVVPFPPLTYLNLNFVPWPNAAKLGTCRARTDPGLKWFPFMSFGTGSFELI